MFLSLVFPLSLLGAETPPLLQQQWQRVGFVELAAEQVLIRADFAFSTVCQRLVQSVSWCYSLMGREGAAALSSFRWSAVGDSRKTFWLCSVRLVCCAVNTQTRFCACMHAHTCTHAHSEREREQLCLWCSWIKLHPNKCSSCELHSVLITTVPAEATWADSRGSDLKDSSTWWSYSINVLIKS